TSSSRWLTRSSKAMSLSARSSRRRTSAASIVGSAAMSRLRLDSYSELREQRIGIGGYIDRSGAIGNGSRRLQPVAGYAEDDPVRGADLASPARLAERPK